MATLLIKLGNTRINEAQLAQIEAALPDGMDILFTKDDDEIARRVEDIELCAGYFPTHLVKDAVNLRWWQTWSAGVNWLLDHPEWQALPFVLTNASGVHAIPTTEHIFGMILMLARQLNHAYKAQLTQTWPGVSFDPNRVTRNDSLFIQDVFELAGKTMVLIGVGEIGGRTAKIADAFGMHVIGVRRNADRSADGVARMVTPAELHDVLPLADIVVSTVPLTAETYHQLNADSFKLMKNRAIIINVGRGKTIDEQAMVAALQNSEIFGAGLDVFEEEPLAADSPLWTLPNVLVTAHYAGDTSHYDERALAIFFDNLERYKRGEPLRNVVDKRAGY